MQATVLNVNNLNVSFDSNIIIADLSFSIQKGDVVAIVGPNGAGKSVLFRALLGLVPYSGKVEWAKELKASYVPQKFSVDKDFPITVKEFLRLKPGSYGDIMAALESVGLKDKQDNNRHIEHHLLSQRMGWLSGGQLQRVLVAWAILDNPDVLLFDEPTSGIDVGGEDTIYNLLKKLNDDRKMTILLISHDLNIVYKYASNVLCLNKKKICFGPPSDVLDPRALVKLYGGEAAFYVHEH